MTERPPDPEKDPLPDDITALYTRARLQGTLQGNRYWDFTASRQEVQGQFRHRIAREHAERAAAGSAALVTPLEWPSDTKIDTKIDIKTDTKIDQPTGAQMQAGQISSAPLSSAPLSSAPLEEAAATSTRIEPILAPAVEIPRVIPAAEETVVPGEMAETRPTESTPASRFKPYAVPANRRESPAEPHEETRWYALHSVLEPPPAMIEPVPARMSALQPFPPLLAVVSLAGGVGKTCIVATLGRALSAFGENVLLADTNPGGPLPFYYGARTSKPGVLRIFSPPAFPSAGHESSTPVRLLSLVSERYLANEGDYDPLLASLVRDGRGVSRSLVDVATGDRALATRLLSLQPTVLVPILPDINSIASVAALQALFASHPCFYLLNQFDPSSPLHLEIRDRLQQRLGESLLPVVVRRCPAVSEALAEGLTVIDYAHDSPAAEDYRRLADWLHHFAAPISIEAGGARWSER